MTEPQPQADEEFTPGGEGIVPLSDDGEAGALAALEQENYRRAYRPSPIIEPEGE